MPEKFLDKYRIPSARWRNWNYAWNAAYFVTICTKDKECYFGNVTDGKMELSELGRIANACWAAIPDHFPFMVLGSFVVMPNHIHGIVIIDRPVDIAAIPTVETQDFASPPTMDAHKAPSPHPLPDMQNISSSENRFGPQSRNLASVIRGFKTGVTISARKIRDDFAWQSRYHDHVIRTDERFVVITNYIENNPENWQMDKFYTDRNVFLGEGR